MTKENQRVAISKRMLKEALLDLLKNKPIDAVTVSELCQAAQINRTTFYRHYETPSDILAEIEHDYIEAFYDIPSGESEKKDLKSYAVRLCRFISDNRNMMKLFLRSNSSSDFVHLVERIADVFLESEVVLYKGKKLDAATHSMVGAFFIAGVCAVIRKWIMEDVPMTPEEVAEMIWEMLGNNITIG